MSLVLFGGSFDPVHFGHIDMVSCVRSYGQVAVIPAFVSPFKTRTATSDADRVAMLKLAFRDTQGVKIESFELDRGGKSYTADTLEHFAKQTDRLYLLMGSDSFCELTTWARPRSIASLAHILVVNRKSVPQGFEAAEAAWKALGGKCTALSGDALDVSSTEIRLKGGFGLPTDGLTPQSVADYIQKNNLYPIYRSTADTLRQFGLSEHRLNHTCLVAVTAAKLSSRFSGDGGKVMAAALFHDVAKNTDFAQAQNKGVILDGSVERMPAPVQHAFIGAEIAKQLLGQADPEVLDAIRYHTTGRANMSLTEKIVALSDYIEPGRDFFEVEKVRSLAEYDLDAACVSMFDKTIKYLRARDAAIDPLTLTALDDLLNKTKNKTNRGEKII